MEYECAYETAEKEVLPAVRYTSYASSPTDTTRRMQIAKELGITQAAISKYVNGKISDKIKTLSGTFDKSLIDVYAKRCGRRLEHGECLHLHRLQQAQRFRCKLLARRGCYFNSLRFKNGRPKNSR